jgi:Tfp pilus assembly protein PilF
MKREILIVFGLIAITAAAFWRVGQCGFVNFDDPEIIYNNPHVIDGLTKANFFWAWEHTDWPYERGLYIPLTILSLMVNAAVFGKGPEGFHWVNLAFHVANAILVFLFFRRATGSVWRSALVAAIFAVHPLRVESVAWVVERKDVLSGFFGLLTLLAYLRYSRSLKATWYLATLILFAASLLSKQSWVTLPFLLLLLDFWPLGRWSKGPAAVDSAHFARRRTLTRLCIEKLPMLAIGVMISIVTLIGPPPMPGRAVSPPMALGLRLGNVPVSYIRYLGNMVWFGNLAVFYPMHAWNTMAIAGSCVLLAAITGICLWNLKSSPWLIVGWLWFVGTLMPMTGIVQIGSHAMADRYTYLSSLGILLLLTWSIPDSVWRSPIAVCSIVGTILCILAFFTMTQTLYWRNSVLLFAHDIDVVGDNYLADANLGVALAERKQWPYAVQYLRKAVAFDPTKAKAQSALATALAETGKFNEAISRARIAINLEPTNASWHYRLAEIYIKDEDYHLAEQECRQAIYYEPRMAEAHDRLGFALFHQGGRNRDAQGEIEQALVLMPDLQMAKDDLQMVRQAGRLP